MGKMRGASTDELQKIIEHELEKDTPGTIPTCFIPVDNAWIETKTGYNPDNGKDGEYGIAYLLVFGIFSQLGRLKEYISTIVYDQNQRADTMQIAYPTQ